MEITNMSAQTSAEKKTTTKNKQTNKQASKQTNKQTKKKKKTFNYIHFTKKYVAHCVVILVICVIAWGAKEERHRLLAAVGKRVRPDPEIG